MMRVRELGDADRDAVMKLHAEMDLDYDLDITPDFIVKNGLFEDQKLVAVAMARLTTEAYMLLDKNWRTPKERLDAVHRIIAVSAAETKLYGINDIHIWLPPKAKKFERRLKRMGFVDAPWKCLTARI